MKRKRTSMPSDETFLLADDPTSKPEPTKQACINSPQIENLLDWLVHHWAKTTVTAREIYTYGPNSIRNKKTTLSLAQILVEQGWLVPIETRQYNTHEWKIVRSAAGAAQVR